MKYCHSDITDPCINLATEEYILTHFDEDDWLMLWQNDKSIIIGMNQNTEEEIDRGFAGRNGITVVRRNTGGGAVYHDLGNLNYSFITSLDGSDAHFLERFSAPICRVLSRFGVSACVGGRNDITVEGKKISGTAQRVYKGRILHHGTLLYNTDVNMLSSALRPHPDKFLSKSTKSVSSRIGNLIDWLPPDIGISQLTAAIRDEVCGAGAAEVRLSDKAHAEILSLAEKKYRSWEWNYGNYPEYGVRQRRRFPGGSVQVDLDVKNGIIQNAVFTGDFMAQTDVAPLADALRGTRYERDDVAGVLGAQDVHRMFGSLTADEILSVIFDHT